MAEQLFLSLPAAVRGGSAGPTRPEDARQALKRWVQERYGDAAAQETVIDNGSGLSRETRVSAQLLARLLQNAWGDVVGVPRVAHHRVGEQRHGARRRHEARADVAEAIVVLVQRHARREQELLRDGDVRAGATLFCSKNRGVAR